MTRSQEFINKFKKVLTAGPCYFNPDTSLMSMDDYNKAKCRILIVFPTPSVVKTVSSTAAALNDFVISHCPDTFIDFCYMPENEDIKRYDEWNMPYAIGNITHLDGSHYDMIGFSISVLNEVVTAPVMLSTFSRCDKPIPLFWSQRKDAKLGEYPIIYAGGITAVCGESMFGKVTIKGKEEQAYLDFMTLGDCGHNNHLTNRFIEAIATGKATRKQEDHDVPGYPHSDIPNFEEVVEVKTIQDYVEALFDLQEIYQPQAYDVEYNKHNQIIKNIKINPKARDFVTPYYPHIMEPDLGIGRAIINANGANCGTAQSACSEGCSAAGSCSFCAEGNYTGGFVQKTKEQILDDLWECKKYSASYKYKPYSFNCIDKDTIVPTSEGFKFAAELTKESHIYSDYGESSELSQLAIFEGERLQFRTQQGPWFTATPNHRHFVLREDGMHEILLGALKEGDYIPYLVGYKEPIVAVLDDYYKLGLWYGDGFYSGNSSYQYVAVQEKKLLDYVIANTDHEVERRKESYRAFMWSHSLTTWFKSICPNKEDLTWLTSLTLSQSLSFIRGLFDSDGCGSGGYLKITQKSSRRLLLQWCSTVLGSIGIRTRLSKDTHVTLNDKDFYRSDLYVIGRESRELFLTYVGSSIDSKIADVKSAKTKWSDKDKCIPPEFGIWTYNCLKSAGLHKGHNSSKFFNGLRGMLVETYLQKFGSFDIEPVALIKRGVRFSKIEQITPLSQGTVIDVVESTTGKFLAGGFITHNTNYLEDYKGMLAEFIKIYPKVTFINMRMEELGRDVDALHMMKLIGSNRISAPMEGLSPRIQNNLLNKCLSEEALNNFMDDMVHAKLTDIKVGGIFTGYEEDIDFQWICDFVDKFKKRAASEGGNFPFRLKCCLWDADLTPVRGRGLLCQSLLKEGMQLQGYTDSVIQKEKPQGICKCMRLTTQQGFSITGTYEHPVLINPLYPENPNSYMFIKDLQPGDIIYGKLGTNCFGEHEQTVSLDEELYTKSRKRPTSRHIVVNEQFAEILGWYCGDGYIDSTSRRRFALCYNDKEQEVLRNHKFYFEVLGFSTKIRASSSIFKLEVNNVALVDLVDKLCSHVDCKKSVPSVILESPKEVQCAFLRGVFSADGACNVIPNASIRMRLCMCNEKFTKDVQVMLANIGIMSTISGPQSKGRKKPKYELYVLRKWQEMFMDQIGFVGSKGKDFHNRRYSTNTYPEVNGFMTLVVKSVEEVADAETYGFTIDSGTYVTNMIVSHNTPLVHYPLTPIEYLERKSAKKSFLGEHWLTDEWYEKFREHQVFFKVNGFRYSTFLEQTFVDLGRSLTPLVYKHFVSTTAPIYSLRSCATDEYLADLRSMIDADVYFNDRDPEHYISPNHRIHIELMGSYIPRARRLLRHKKAGNIFDNEPDIRCLRTFEGAKVKCYHTCIVKDPLKIYNDVTMDEEGNLHGEYVDLTGCQRCPTPQHRLQRLKRPIIQTKNSDDIIATPRIPQVQKIRFVLKRSQEYDCLNPNNVAHTFLTKFLQLSDTLLHSYHSMVCHNMFWQASEGFKFFTAGYQVVDTMWSKNSIKEIRELIPEVNKHLKSCQVITAQDVLRDEKILITDINFYTFESTLPRELFDAAGHTYKGQIKVEAQVQGFALTEIEDSSLQAPVFASKGGKTVGCFWIPTKYNPVTYLMGYLSQAKKTSEDGVVTTTEFACQMTMRESKMPCKCGKEKALISVTTGKPMSFGRSCLMKAILTQMIK